MTEPVETPDQRPDEVTDADREVLAAHDPLGTDLASQIAEATRTSLPPTMGVRRSSRRRRRRAWVDGDVRSGSGPDARDPQTLGTLFDRLVADRGWQREVNLRHLLDRWDALVGATNAAHSTPESYADTVLTIRCDSTAWATNLRMLAPSLVAKLNAQLGDGTVTRIVIQGPTSAHAFKRGPRTVRDGRGPRDTYG